MKSLRVALSCLFAVLIMSKSHLAEDAAKKKRTPKPNPAMARVDDVPGLPRVLLIGDSISIGYTVPVQTLLKGIANVHRPLTNCGPTTKGLAEIEAWLGSEKWEVIHFNWGLHDLKYLGPNGKNLADPKATGSKQQVPPVAYEANIRKLVARLKKTDAKLIWRSTTPVPKGAVGRVVGDTVRYNGIAAKIMKENNIPTDDHYTFAMPQLDQIQRPANVHFTPEGSQELAKHAVAAIRRALPK